MGISVSDYKEICRRLNQNPVNGLRAVPAINAAPRSRNKWEEAFEREELEPRVQSGEIRWAQFEGLRFRLADDAYYKPDFVALWANGELVAYEVKGMWREAARVRIKVVADHFPFRFIAVRKRKVSEGGGWEYEQFSAWLDRRGR